MTDPSTSLSASIGKLGLFYLWHRLGPPFMGGGQDDGKTLTGFDSYDAMNQHLPEEFVVRAIVITFRSFG